MATLHYPRAAATVPFLIASAAVLVLASACSRSDDSKVAASSEPGPPSETGAATAAAVISTAGPLSASEIGVPEFNFGEPTFSGPISAIHDIIAGTPKIDRDQTSVPAGGSIGKGSELAFEDVRERDAILAVFDPAFVSAAEADEFMADTELVLGLSVGSDSRAYSIPYMSGRELVNDVVGGKPVAVTW